MTAEDITLLAWGLAISVIFLVSSWVFLVMQAFFHDRRIALTGVFSAATAALSMAISEKLAYGLLYLAGAICLAFIVWFLISQFRNIRISLCAGVFALSAVSTGWFYSQLPNPPESMTQQTSAPE